jgi:hypothetical protein
MVDEVRYISQDVDYLGFLATKLVDLRGMDTLVYELVQNADDVRDEAGRPAATRITFDIYEDALVVENDGVFRPQDFDRMKHIAGGDKRYEDGTTGAFGIGFISTYFVTDSPEIFSNGRHWSIHPEEPAERRIAERRASVEGTRFRLPWAYDPASMVRQKLRIDAVQRENVRGRQVFIEISDALSLAALFPKQLRIFELKDKGMLVKRFEHTAEGDGRIRIVTTSGDAKWHTFQGNFPEDELRLRLSYGLQIERKRHSYVQVAVGEDSLSLGRLFAVLPTQTITPLPFHINADFFPTSDRKRILLDEGFRGNWNRAAIRAAARAVTADFDRLQQLLGHREMWQVLQRMADCRQKVEARECDGVFREFWSILAPLLPGKRIVFSSKREWVRPDQARLLDRGTERDAATVFEALKIPIVHADLIPHHNLMMDREIGVPLVAVQDVVSALRTAGLSKTTTLEQAPEGLRTIPDWKSLWAALSSMFKRVASSALPQARASLASCAIAMDTDGDLRLPSEIYRGDAATRQLFSEGGWLDETRSSDEVPGSLVNQFALEDAVGYLSRHAQFIGDLWAAGQWSVENLVLWLEARSDLLLRYPALVQRLREVPVWPASGRLQPLTGLYLPGDFEDPLQLSGLIDTAALGGRRDLLHDLQVRERTFAAYVRDLPRILTSESALPVEKRRGLIQLLAQKLGEITGDTELKAALAGLDLVECTDGSFRPAGKVYAESEVVRFLDAPVFIAAIPGQNPDAVRALYDWLGIAQEPRSTDVIRMLQELAPAPDELCLKRVRAVFTYLAGHWTRWDEPTRQEYSALRSLAWLPQKGDRDAWHTGETLNSTYRVYLFETQGRFVDLLDQYADGASGVLDFLGVRREPTVRQVVDHLLTCSRRQLDANPEVYRFLSDNAADPAIRALTGTCCIQLEAGHFVAAAHVFWQPHHFGSFRVQLSQEWRRFDPFLRQVGVRETPEISDYIDVLLEIASQYGQDNPLLDESVQAVVLGCWKALSDTIDVLEAAEPQQAGELGALYRSRLAGKRVVLNFQKILREPDSVFFEDRAGLAAKFLGSLDNSVIPRQQGTWRAMLAAGVQPLSKAVTVSMSESADTVPDDDLAGLIEERRALIQRVVASQEQTEATLASSEVLERLKCQKAGRLTVQYSLEDSGRSLNTAPESVPALYLARSNLLCAVYEDHREPWAAIARELAFAIKSEGEIGPLAGGIKEALSGPTIEDAQHALDDLAYPPLEDKPPEEVPSLPPIAFLGGLGKECAAAPLGFENGVPISSTGKSSVPGSDPTIGSPSGSAAPVDKDGFKETPGADDSHTPGARPETPGKSVAAGPTGQGGVAPRASSQRPAVGGAVGGAKRVGTPTAQFMLLSYVLPKGWKPDKGMDPGSFGENRATDEAGIKRVMEHEGANGRDASEMLHGNVGYDIESRDAMGDVRYIEAKSLSGDWDRTHPAALTPAQFNMAREKGPTFWLYVVERCMQADYQIHCIQDPASDVQRFLFDNGWKAMVREAGDGMSDYAPRILPEAEWPDDGEDLIGAKLVEVNLTGVAPSGANVSGVDLTMANLTDARLIGVKLAEDEPATAKQTRTMLPGVIATKATPTADPSRIRLPEKTAPKKGTKRTDQQPKYAVDESGLLVKFEAWKASVSRQDRPGPQERWERSGSAPSGDFHSAVDDVKEFTVRCSVCGRNCDTWRRLKKHMRENHANLPSVPSSRPGQ